MRRATLYLRVSTTEQTTANQERELREVAARMAAKLSRITASAVPRGVTSGLGWHGIGSLRMPAISAPPVRPSRKAQYSSN